MNLREVVRTFHTSVASVASADLDKFDVETNHH